MTAIKNAIQMVLLLCASLVLQYCQSLDEVIVRGNSANNQIKNLTDPTNDQDAATKAYVDSILEAFGIILPDNYAGMVADIDGNTYRTVTIGIQTWMAENLRTERLADGSPIPKINNITEWGNLETPAYCWYDNSFTYKTIFGAIYNRYAVETSNLCPTGWHVPTDAEWTILITNLGGTSVAGGKLKEIGTKHWKSPNAGATNESGFTALPGGAILKVLYGGSTFIGIGQQCEWWSSTPSSWNVSWNNSDVSSATGSEEVGFYVRCIKD